MNRDLLEKLQMIYKKNAAIPEGNPVLNFQPVTDAELDIYQQDAGFEFCDELRELYKIANGTLSNSNDEPHMYFISHVFNSMDNAIKIHRDLKEFSKTASPAEYDDALQDNLYKDYYFNFKLGAIQHTEFHPSWFPLGCISGMSTYVMVDHSPGDKGKYGQVIFVDLGRKALVLAACIEQYLEKIIKHAVYIHRQEDDYKTMLRIAKGSFRQSMSF